MSLPKDIKEEERRAKLRVAAKRNRADPNSVYNTEEYKAKQLAAAKKGKSRPEVRARNSVLQKIAQNRPEVKEKHSAAAKRNRADPNSTYNSEEYRARMCISQKTAHNRPEVRAKQAASAKVAHNRPEVKAKISGPNHHSWNGGSSTFPYPFDFNKELKSLIRERDHNTCQLCGRIREEEGKNLCVHHINYDKDDLFELNLVTLCGSCNSKVNKNRNMWKDYFTFKMMYGITRASSSDGRAPRLQRGCRGFNSPLCPFLGVAQFG